MPMAELKASGWLLHQQLRNGEGAEGHHHVDEAIHAVEHDGPRTNHKASRDACDAGQRRHQNGEFQRALLRSWVHILCILFPAKALTTVSCGSHASPKMSASLSLFAFPHAAAPKDILFNCCPEPWGRFDLCLNVSKELCQ